MMKHGDAEKKRRTAMRKKNIAVTHRKNKRKAA